MPPIDFYNLKRFPEHTRELTKPHLTQASLRDENPLAPKEQ